jgi:hypothetical protein
VFLEIMAFARNIGCDLHAISQADTSYFPERGVGLFGCGGVNPGAYPAFKGTTLKSGGFRLSSDLFTALANKLIDCRHNFPLAENCKKIPNISYSEINIIFK